MRNTETQATRIIEVNTDSKYSDQKPLGWRPVAELRGFTHQQALAELNKYSHRFGMGNARMR